MAKLSGQQSLSSGNGSDHQNDTLYDKYVRTLPPPSEEKSSKGKLYNWVCNFCHPAGGDTPSSNKDQKQDGLAASNGNAENATQTQNDSGEGRSSQKKKIPKTYEYPPKVRGFEYDEMSLEMMLLQGERGDSFKTIGVVGLPGVGKTTLCKLILNNERVKDSYGRMKWISLSESEKPKTEHAGVTEDIIEHISDEHRLPELLGALNQELKEMKYLIVLDDVREGEADSCYEALKTRFVDRLPREKGGAVIVTSRSEKVAKKIVGDKNLHRLLPLSDPQSCWLIYNDAVYAPATPEDSTASKDVMDKLMEKCGGLPGAAQMMGKIKNANMKKK